MTEKRIKALEDEVQGLRSRVEKLEKALETLLPREGELIAEKVREGILKGDVGPLMKWIRRGLSVDQL